MSGEIDDLVFIMSAIRHGFYKYKPRARRPSMTNAARVALHASVRSPAQLFRHDITAPE
jgi:hypothetical protein